jgi:Beta-galactosidase
VPSGIFALGPTEAGFAVYASGDPAAPCDETMAPAANGKFLCPESGPANAPLQEILDSDAIVGVLLRFEWDEIEIALGVYDWSVLDREVDRVAKAGKHYSLAFKAAKAGTPDWLFTDLGLSELRLQDGGSHGGGCGFEMSLGNPATPLYGERYRMFLSAAAEHLKENPAWYRALAYVKPSGANLITHENRLPNSCDPACPVCNTAVWAADGYTPAGLYAFYQEQFQAIADAFSEKAMSYMLIQAGFPRVTDATDYLGCTAGCDPTNIPGGVEQTEEILAIGAGDHGALFVVQHNGLSEKPTGAAACPNDGIHPATGPFAAAGTGCPNPYVLRAGEDGQVTGFQTVNRSQVDTLAALDATFLNALDNSDAVFVEAYESLLWEAIETGGALDPGAATPRTLLDWTSELDQRRRLNQFVSMGLPDPYPRTHSHTFTRTIGATGNEIYHYVDPATCGVSAPYNYGVIRILP